jgi:hypothetical protein
MLRILRGLGSHTLACGCLVGVYETYASETVAVIDAKGVKCGNAAHGVDAPIEYEEVVARNPAHPPSTTPTMNR